jgi:hypothetical protein
VDKLPSIDVTISRRSTSSLDYLDRRIRSGSWIHRQHSIECSLRFAGLSFEVGARAPRVSVARTEAGADGAATWRMAHWHQRSIERSPLSDGAGLRGVGSLHNARLGVSSTALLRGSFGAGAARQSNNRLERSRVASSVSQGGDR